jgi:hypothetical protein
MFFWFITSVLTLALAGIGIIAVRRHPSTGSRGWVLTGLGVLASVLYTAVALYPWRGYDDAETSLFVLGALPIGFVTQTVGAVLFLKTIVVASGGNSLLNRLGLAGNIVVLLGVLALSLVLGDGFYVLAALTGACVFTIVMFYVYYALLRDEQRA